MCPMLLIGISSRDNLEQLAAPPNGEHAKFQISLDTLGFEPRAFRMRSGCDATTPCAHGYSMRSRPLMDAHRLGRTSSAHFPLPPLWGRIEAHERPGHAQRGKRTHLCARAQPYEDRLSEGGGSGGVIPDSSLERAYTKMRGCTLAQNPEGAATMGMCECLLLIFHSFA